MPEAESGLADTTLLFGLFSGLLSYWDWDDGDNMVVFSVVSVVDEVLLLVVVVLVVVVVEEEEDEEVDVFAVSLFLVLAARCFLRNLARRFLNQTCKVKFSTIEIKCKVTLKCTHRVFYNRYKVR